MIKLKDTKTALEKFEEAASKHAEATEQGDYKTANRCYAIIVKAIAFLKEQNEMHQLLKSLNHNSVGVRIWAATYLLAVEEREGIRVLEQIAKGTGICTFTAKTTLNEWKKGNLKL
ncbi:DUF2019 domain-containing protein [Bacteroides sp. UBA939]|uniref:DUF2019 domain-containing protein n=1 Tax=Bacteroides sp. UBA939 TaxID=1946092 RepID=UPI0025C139EC|nr:DUF2019 domain-containing protein [Bacteroides sp. UBA939]